MWAFRQYHSFPRTGGENLKGFGPFWVSNFYGSLPLLVSLPYLSFFLERHSKNFSSFIPIKSVDEPCKVFFVIYEFWCLTFHGVRGRWPPLPTYLSMSPSSSSYSHNLTCTPSGPNSLSRSCVGPEASTSRTLRERQSGRPLGIHDSNLRPFPHRT